jgi:prepilin-type N-terminal cleavage/methylation domain-containing protein
MFLVAPCDNHRGFTLVEFLVAVTILTIGILALLQVVNLSIAQNNSNKKRNDAILICDQSLGIERSRAFGNVTSANSVVQQKVALGFVNYSVLERVTKLTSHSLASNQIAGAKQVMFTVAWREKNVRKTHSLTSTIIETAN